MTCMHCEKYVKLHLEDLPGISSAKVNLQAGEATVEFDASKITTDEIIASLNKTNYKVA